MTKQRWETIKGLQEVPMDVWFEYYKESGGVLQEGEFIRLFQEMVASNPVVRNSAGNLSQINLGSSLEKLYNYYNKKFSE